MSAAWATLLKIRRQWMVVSRDPVKWKGKRYERNQKKIVTTQPPREVGGEENRQWQNVRQSEDERLVSAWWKGNCAGHKRWPPPPGCENTQKSFGAVSSCEDRIRPDCYQKARQNHA